MNNRIQIPNTDLSICPIGLGAVNAGCGWEDAVAGRIFDTYFDCGGNMIDTARVYAGGRSEEVVGKWLKNSGKRDQVVIITKGGHPKFDSPEDDLHISRMTREDMQHDIETSLRLLQTDCIDLYFYHRDDRKQSVEEEIETMELFRREGKIRYYGCSNWGADRIMEADQYCKKMGYRGFAADQALLNIGMKYMNPLPDDTLVYIRGDLHDYHVRNTNNLAMPYMSVASGFFHNFIAKGEDAVKSSPYYTQKNIEIAEKCKILMKKYSATITQVVLGFLMHQPFACAPLYGPKNEVQIKEALAALEMTFDKADYDF